MSRHCFHNEVLIGLSKIHEQLRVGDSNKISFLLLGILELKLNDQKAWNKILTKYNNENYIKASKKKERKKKKKNFSL